MTKTPLNSMYPAVFLFLSTAVYLDFEQHIRAATSSYTLSSWDHRATQETLSQSNQLDFTCTKRKKRKKKNITAERTVFLSVVAKLSVSLSWWRPWSVACVHSLGLRWLWSLLNCKLTACFFSLSPAVPLVLALWPSTTRSNRRW